MIRPECDALIVFLNSLAQIDPVAMGKLVAARVPCNDEMRDHPTVQTGDEGGVVVVGLLGILNGWIGIIETGQYKGWGEIAALAERDGRVTGFVKTSQA